MAIFLTCRCGQMYRTQDEFAGRSTSCPRCARPLIVPGVSAEEDDDREFALPKNARIFCRRAVFSFLLGFCSLGVAFLTGIPAIIYGVQGFIEVRQAKGKLRGAPLALFGIALGLFGCFAVTPTYVIPAVRQVVAYQRRQACVNNMKQIGLALHNYIGQNGVFPLPAITDGRGKPLLSWRVAILPYLGPREAALYRRFHLDEPWDGPNNSILLYQMPQVYACPVIPSRDRTVYQALTGPGTIFPGDRATRLLDLTRGTVNTQAVIEGPISVQWSSPVDMDLGDPNLGAASGTHHYGSSNTLYADGSVR